METCDRRKKAGACGNSSDVCQLGDCNKPPGRTKRPNQMALGVEVVEDAA